MPFSLLILDSNILEINFLHLLVLADSSLEKKTSSVGDWSWTTMKDFLATQNMENIIKLYGQEKSEKVCKFYVSAGSRDGLPISTCPRPLSLTSPPVSPFPLKVTPESVRKPASY